MLAFFHERKLNSNIPLLVLLKIKSKVAEAFMKDLEILVIIH